MKNSKELSDTKLSERMRECQKASYKSNASKGGGTKTDFRNTSVVKASPTKIQSRETED